MTKKKTWRDIQGWLSDGEGDELQRLAQGRRVIEVGAWKGKSSICMAEVAASVVSCDWFRGDAFTGAAFTLPDFVRTLDEHESRGLITPIVGDQKTVLPLLRDGLFQFVYYDGDHTGEATQFALEWAAAHQPGAVIAVHDYDPTLRQYADAIKVVDSFRERHGKAMRVVGTLAVLENVE